MPILLPPTPPFLGSFSLSFAPPSSSCASTPPPSRTSGIGPPSCTSSSTRHLASPQMGHLAAGLGKTVCRRWRWMCGGVRFRWFQQCTG